MISEFDGFVWPTESVAKARDDRKDAASAKTDNVNIIIPHRLVDLVMPICSPIYAMLMYFIIS